MYSTKLLQINFGLWFHQGATLKDASNKLINAQDGKTKVLRQWRMTHANEIKPSIIEGSGIVPWSSLG